MDATTTNIAISNAMIAKVSGADERGEMRYYYLIGCSGDGSSGGSSCGNSGRSEMGKEQSDQKNNQSDQNDQKEQKEQKNKQIILSEICKIESSSTSTHSIDYINSIIPPEYYVSGILIAYKEEIILDSDCIKNNTILSELVVSFPNEISPLIMLYSNNNIKLYNYSNMTELSYSLIPQLSSPILVVHLSFKYPYNNLNELTSYLSTCIFNFPIFQTQYNPNDITTDNVIESFYKKKKKINDDIWNSTVLPTPNKINRLSDISSSLIKVQIGQSIYATDVLQSSYVTSYKSVPSKTISLELLTYADMKSSLSSIVSRLLISLNRQLSFMKLTSSENINSCVSYAPIFLNLPFLHSFYSDSSCCNINKDSNKDAIVKQDVTIDNDKLASSFRARTHNLFDLKSSYFRLPKSVFYSSKFNSSLNTPISPHLTPDFESLQGRSVVKQGTEYLVDGEYGYFHYLQHGENDAGWGCAYRSLQTLSSFLFLNGYTTILPPAIDTIQSILITHDDKPEDLLGSKNWIGAIEVSTVLQVRYGISCKILRVNKGSELKDKARDLSKHFLTQGTPIMMGGGQYAYTLLGISWNEFTGDIKFLILDPHYKGADDLKTIISKGWCAWKTCDLFDQNSFYNLCCMQRPTNY